MAASAVILRLMLPDPQYLGCRPSGKGRVGRNLNPPLPGHDFKHILHFPAGPLVAPDDGGADDLTLPVQHHKSVHLPGYTDSFNVFCRHTGLLRHCLKGCKHRIPPILRPLLRPSVLRLIQRVFPGSRCCHGSILIKQDGLGCRRPHINPNQIIHLAIPLSLAAYDSSNRNLL